MPKPSTDPSGETTSSHLDREHLLTLVNADAVAKAQPLAMPERWRAWGRDDRAVWGEVRGAQREPYRVQVDLRGPAFRCTCPARRVPCRHALGLALLLVDQPASVPRSRPPAWVSSWLASRDARERSRTAPVDELTRRQREAAQVRRADGREHRVQAGVEELSRFLQDLVRRGLASLSDAGYRTWDEMAARMVDAQAPGLARLVRELGGLAHSGPGWEDPFLERIGRLHLLLQAFTNLDQLAPEVQSDVRTLVGFPTPREQLADQPVVNDVWWVLGRRLELQDQLQIQRVWMVGQASRRFALVLGFAAGGKTLDASLAPGAFLQGEARYYPGSVPMRAAFDASARLSPRDAPARIDVFQPIAEAWRGQAEALRRLPWLERFPMALAHVIPDVTDAGWRLRDLQGTELPVRPYGEDGWIMLATSGGHAIDVFGEWTGDAFVPMSVLSDDGFLELARNPLFMG